MPDVLFVGAGPVGLFTAIQAKLSLPHLDILMLEKYAEYQRKHPLLLDDSSFVGTHPDPEFQQLIKDLPHTIRTNDLESRLLTLARKLGITIEQEYVENCEEVAARYPDARIIIGGDGSHSKVHEQMFKGEYQVQTTLQYIAEVKYEVSGRARYLSRLTEAIPALSYTDHLVTEFVGKEKEGTTPVSLRIFITEETYNAMRAATFKSPYSFADKEKIDPSVLSTIQAWLTAREKMADEVRVEGSERITVTNLPVYASRRFAFEKEGRIWALVGDAAFGVPYFRALNNGILCSSKLASMIFTIFTGCKPAVQSKLGMFSGTSSSSHEVSPVDTYHQAVQSLVTKEVIFAHIKRMGIASLETSAASTQAFPVTRAKLVSTQQGRSYKTAMKKPGETVLEEASPREQSGCRIL